MQIGLGHGHRFLEHRADLIAQPRLQAVIEEHDGGNGDDNRRHHRDEAEKAYQPYMKARTGRAASPLDPQRDDPPRQRDRQQQQNDEVDIEPDQNLTRFRSEWHDSADRREGAGDCDQRGDGERQAENAPELQTLKPGSEPTGKMRRSRSHVLGRAHVAMRILS